MKKLFIIILIVLSCSSCSSFMKTLDFLDFMLSDNTIHEGVIVSVTHMSTGGIVCFENNSCYKVENSTIGVFRGRNMSIIETDDGYKVN